MRTVTFLEIYNDAVRRRGMDPAVVTLTSAMQEDLAVGIERHLRYAWRADWWPDLMLCERRQARATYAAGTTYAAAEELYYTDGTDENYFVSLQGTNTGHTPSFDGATEWWEEADDEFEFSIAFDQSWESTDIERLDPTLHVFEDKPTLTANAAPLADCRVFGSTLYLPFADAPVRPWLLFMPTPPRFTRVAYAAGTTYAAGALVYGSDGDCYVSLQGSNTGHTPSSSPTWWAKQEFPEMFRHFVRDAMYAEWLSDEEARGRAWRDARRELESLREMCVQAVSGPADAVVEL
jgi:hypothetical protein